MGQTLVFFTFLILLAVGFVFGFRAYDKKLKSKNWGDEAFSGSTTGRVYFDGNAVAYAYIVGNRGYTRHFFPDKTTGDLLPEMPLEEGDEFVVRFHPDRPNFSRILFSQPTEAQREKYVERAMAVHLSLHADEHPSQVRCMLELAVELYGPGAFADFFYQATPSRGARRSQPGFLLSPGARSRFSAKAGSEVLELIFYLCRLWNPYYHISKP
jgi:hypothetical protein